MAKDDDKNTPPRKQRHKRATFTGLSDVERYRKMLQRLGITKVPLNPSDEELLNWLLEDLVPKLLYSQPEFKIRQTKPRNLPAEYWVVLAQAHRHHVETGQSPHTGLREMVRVGQKCGVLASKRDPDNLVRVLWRHYQKLNRFQRDQFLRLVTALTS
jgi:hypothetical protein